MPKELKISKSLSLPIDTVTRRLAFLGGNESGKSYAAMKLAELFYEVKAQFVAIDPVGVWYGLRLDGDGKSAGLLIPVFGGLHGDVPLRPSDGALIADLIVDQKISAIIDISQFEYDTDKARFVRDFADRFFFRKKSKKSAIHVFLEEGQEFVPQNPAKGEEQMLHAINRIWKIDRNFGIGGSIISQRPQEINKKSLNLSQCVFAFQTLGSHERKSIEEWIRDKNLDETIANDLPKLKRGEPHIWAPAWLGISHSVKIAKRWTFNSSSTPDVGEESKVKELAPIDIKKLSEKMKATIEKAKADDPQILKKRIRELEIQASKPQAKMDPKAMKAEIAKAVEFATKNLQKKFQSELDVIQKEQVQIFEGLRHWYHRMTDLRNNDNRIYAEFPKLIEKIGTKKHTLAIPILPTVTIPASPIVKDVFQKIDKLEKHPISITDEGEVKLAAGARRLLEVLVSWSPNGLPENQWRSNAGLRKTGTLTTYKSTLVTAGYIEKRIDGKFYALQAGIDRLGGNVPDAPKTTQEVLAIWNSKLPDGARRMLNALVEKAGEFVSEEELLNLAELKKTGTYTTYKSLLSNAHLIVTERGKGIAANKETLFL